MPEGGQMFNLKIYQMKNLFLSIVIATTGFVSCSIAQTESFKTIETNEFQKMTENKDAVILDVRTPEEYAEGHLKNSTNINFNAADFEQQISKLDAKKTYLVYCRSGKRSANASGLMTSKGFKNVVNLKDGIIAWQEQGNEVVK